MQLRLFVNCQGLLMKPRKNWNRLIAIIAILGAIALLTMSATPNNERPNYLDIYQQQLAKA